MTPLKFRRYSPGASDKTVIGERIIYWESINYNGVTGCRIYLDDGLTVDVGETDYDIRTALVSANLMKEKE